MTNQKICAVYISKRSQLDETHFGYIFDNQVITLKFQHKQKLTQCDYATDCVRNVKCLTRDTLIMSNSQGPQFWGQYLPFIYK